MPALQYLQSVRCRMASCSLSCSSPAHACATIFTSSSLQDGVLQPVMQLSCACLRFAIYKQFAAGWCPAACPAAVVRFDFYKQFASGRCPAACPAHACAPIFASSSLQDGVLQPVLRMPALHYLQGVRCRMLSCSLSAGEIKFALQA